MAQSRIAIIGTGLIGTSLGLNLMSQKERKFEVVGADRDRGHSREAKKRGALDREVGSLEEAVEGAGLVILSVPVLGARKILREIAPLLPPGAIVTDTCSTKGEIMRWAAECLPETAHFVGGHPMAGSEQSGPGAAAVDLFRGATWAITPAPKADEAAIQVVLGLIEMVGASALYIDPEEHDQYAAAVSHLPILLSVALFRMVRDSRGWDDAALLAGPAFRDLTRLASGDPTMSKDIMATNRDAVLHWLHRFQEDLAKVAAAIEAGGDPAAALFKMTALDRDTFIMNPPVRRPPAAPESPSAMDSMGRLFVGGMYDKWKDATNRVPTAKTDGLRRKLGIDEDQ